MFFMAEGGDGGGGGAVGAVGAVGSGGGGTATAATPASSTSSSGNVSGGEKSSTSEVSDPKDSAELSPQGKDAAQADSAEAEKGGSFDTSTFGQYQPSSFSNGGLNVGPAGNIPVDMADLSPTESDLANLNEHYSNFDGTTVTFAGLLEARHNGADGFSAQFSEGLKSAETQAYIAQHGTRLESVSHSEGASGPRRKEWWA